MTLMQGFPPAPELQVTLANWRTAPYCSWAFHHVREIVPSAEIANDPDNVWTLPDGELDLSGADLEQGLAPLQNDALVILHKGRLVHESYRNGMTASDPHILMSVSKSMLGLLAGISVDRGEIDLAAPLTEYIPELAGTAYSGANVRDALDMRVGVRFDEDYFVTKGPIIDYRYAANWNPVPDGVSPMDLRSFQLSLKDRDGDHGGRFHYVSPVTDLLAWVLERASGQRYADLFSERIWQPLGAERPGYITVDRTGAPRGAGGKCFTAQDLARVGQMMVQGGAREGQQIVPESWIQDIAGNGDAQAWRDGDFYEDFGRMELSYRSKWYVRPKGDGLIHGLGIHGQYLFVDPAREMVIAMFSSEGKPIDDAQTAYVFALVEKIRSTVG
ncbi:MAG: serine hydrolase domain-containing protein [Paracoccaceae bacterium]